MSWLLFDGWLRFDTEKAYAFSWDEEDKDILFFIPKSQIGEITYKGKGDRKAGDPAIGFGVQVEAIEVSDWLAEKLAEEYELEIDK